MAVKVTFPDGAVREYESGITVEEVAASISSGLKKECGHRQSERKAGRFKYGNRRRCGA